jgi:hypothetical protein
VEWDVVFADEVEGFGLFVKPVLAPFLGLPHALALLDGC